MDSNFKFYIYLETENDIRILPKDSSYLICPPDTSAWDRQIRNVYSEFENVPIKSNYIRPNGVCWYKITNLQLLNGKLIFYLSWIINNLIYYAL